ncbi:hypothetical protein, partial [Methanocalculus sp.]|uniref:hypothetical protein n=1 Tax=Methanocalculus sp. TaxID=2004547 RepID=UPI002602855B
MTVRPIPTHYNGYYFRSRAEARWAVFFDALGISYEYEKEGYQLDNGMWYLPDFWLPHLGAYVEIKGQPLTEKSPDYLKLRAFAKEFPIYVFKEQIVVPPDITNGPWGISNPAMIMAPVDGE